MWGDASAVGNRLNEGQHHIALETNPNRGSFPVRLQINLREIFQGIVIA